jgi:hypothetical protein
MARLKWGMIGGGEGSQIGPAHRLGAGLDGEFEFVPARSTTGPKPAATMESARLDPSRLWRLARDAGRREKPRPTASIWSPWPPPTPPIMRSPRPFLEAGFHVLCEKPMTMTVEEGEDIVRTARATGAHLRGQLRLHRLFAGPPHEGDGRARRSGKIRLVKAEFAHGHHADAADADNPRVRWRYDPAQAGVSAQFADCGIHALHMASFVTGEEVEKLSADTVSCISSRELEDDAMVNFRMDGGVVGRLWTSSSPSAASTG